MFFIYSPWEDWVGRIRRNFHFIWEYEYESARNRAMRMQSHHSNLSLRFGDCPMLSMLQYPVLVYSVGSVHPPIPVFPQCPPRFRLSMPEAVRISFNFFSLVKSCDSFFFNDFLLPIVCCV